MKDLILEERSKGKTILLTTHNMQDAAELCDRVAFIVNGRIMALDSARAYPVYTFFSSFILGWQGGIPRQIFGNGPVNHYVTGLDGCVVEK